MTKRGLAVWRSCTIEALMITVGAALLMLYVDLPLALRLARATAGEAGLPPLDAVAHFGRGEYYAAAAAILLGLGLWLLRRPQLRRRRTGWRLLQAGSLIAGTLAFGHLVVLALKQVIARLRPAELADGEYGFALPFSGEPFTSLPSSHSFTAFAMAAVLSRLQPDLRAAFFGVAMLVAVQRMLAQQHFLSDVFVSLFLALMVSSAVQAVWQAGATRLARRLLRRPPISAAPRSAGRASVPSSLADISASPPRR